MAYRRPAAKTRERKAARHATGGAKVSLALLFVAFGAALAIKAWQERSAEERETLDAVDREALALSADVRAELVSARTRLETLLASGASLDSIRRAGSFAKVVDHAAANGHWAQLSDGASVTVFAHSGSKSVAGMTDLGHLFGQTTSRRSLATPEPGAENARFAMVDGKRTATACAPIADSGVSACVARDVPLLGLGDLERVAGFLLLFAAPALAVAGVSASMRGSSGERRREARSSRSEPGAQRSTATGASSAAEFSEEFGVPGIAGHWSWRPASGVLTLSNEAARLLSALAPGDRTLAEFGELVAAEDRKQVMSGVADLGPRTRNKRVSLSFRGAGPAAASTFEMIGGADTKNGFGGLILDVTDRANAQSRSRRAEAGARAALDAHPGPFAIWDSRRRLTHWNSEFEKSFNLEPDVLQPGASYDQVSAEIAKFVRVERPLGEDSNSRELLLISDRWVRLTERRTSFDGLITMGLDISHLKAQEADLSKKERTLRRAVIEHDRLKGKAQELAMRLGEQKALAERANQTKSNFLASMSHELRTPLNAINGFSEMLLREVYGPLGDRRYKAYAEDILQSGKHLLDLIDDILDMAKIEAGKMQISPQLIDPVDPIDAAVRMIGRQAADKGVALRLEAPRELPEINADHRAVKQMVLNLIANAIKFSNKGGEIVVAVSHEADWLAIRVRDNGIGIAEKDLPRLGQAFEQSRPADGRHAKGTGLGLAITKSFAELHGGRLEIASKLGVGTCVSILLPAPVAASDAALRSVA